MAAVSIASLNVGSIKGMLATRVDPVLGACGPTPGVVAAAERRFLPLGLRARAAIVGIA